LLASLVASWAAAGEQDDASSDQPLVMVNTNCGDPAWHAVNGGHSRFYMRVRAAGYRVDQRHMTSFSDEELAGVDILVLPNVGGWAYNPSGPSLLTDEDKEALRRFLLRGGGILIHAFSQYMWSDFSNIDSFTRDYGIWFGPHRVAGRLGYIEDECHLAYTRPCKTLATSSGYWGDWRRDININPENAVAAVKTVLDEILVAYSTSPNLGTGRIVVIGSDMCFYNGHLDLQDNSNFGLNVIDYLSGRFDLRVAQCKFKKAGSKRKIQATAIVHNIRRSASNATNVTFFLFSTGSYVADSEDLVANLGRLNMAALNPGESIELTRTVKIRKNTSPGDYYIIAVADPDGTSGDVDTDNNYRAAGKLVSVR